MKIAYVLIPSIVAVSAAVGAAIATVHQSAPDVRPTPTPITTPSTPTPSTAPIASPTPSTPAPERPAPAPERPAAEPTPEPLSRRSPVTIDGIGPVRVGMTVAQAEAAAGIPIRSAGDSGNESCSYFEPQGIDGLSFMVTEGRISRVDVIRGSSIATLSGAGIGNTEAEIEAIYPGQIEVSPHEYVPGGHYLMFVPNDAADRNYRLVFETDENGVVTQFRSGKLSEVTWVEGCA
ncbi:hypothetical protein H6F67_22965 [Microcoleus sp. FACHB-1515]|uniref:hypothetical protein n=1 Tax=Cyanophyceae TaxID=3028117 RepID=UPI00168A2B07|nr:hypothetical protein [Microcoleus sp. FACHB-1515]MBD2092716.1 hypothetical protein [Microcoleus sp. FACHB-1515]